MILCLATLNMHFGCGKEITGIYRVVLKSVYIILIIVEINSVRQPIIIVWTTHFPWRKIYGPYGNHFIRFRICKFRTRIKSGYPPLLIIRIPTKHISVAVIIMIIQTQRHGKCVVHTIIMGCLTELISTIINVSRQFAREAPRWEQDCLILSLMRMA
mgnify:CR=1 FL=1